MAMLVDKDKLQNDMCYDEIKLRAQNVDTILSSILEPYNWEGNLTYVQ